MFSVVSPDQTVDAGDVVTLTVEAVDPEGTDILYQWRLLSSGPGVALNGVYTSTATFVAPSVGVDTVLLFEVTASDLNAGQSSAVVSVTVRADNDPPDVTVRAPASVVEGRTGHLLGRATDDWTDRSRLTYEWTQTGGPAAILNNADQARATFVAPEVDSDTTLTFQLTATDAGGAQGTAFVTATVRPAN